MLITAATTCSAQSTRSTCSSSRVWRGNGRCRMNGYVPPHWVGCRSSQTGACTLCGQILPRCIICAYSTLMRSLTIELIAGLRHVEARFSSAHAHDRDEMDPIPPHAAPSDTIEQAYICCLTCRHGGGCFEQLAGQRKLISGHANHILPWFQGGLDGEGAHDVCPVAGCPCECANI